MYPCPDFPETKQSNLILLLLCNLANISSSFTLTQFHTSGQFLEMPVLARIPPFSRMNLMTEQNDVNYFQYVDSNISCILEMEVEEPDITASTRQMFVVVELQKCLINWRALEDYLKSKNNNGLVGTHAIQMDVLVDVASQCECILFGIDKHQDFDLPVPIGGLIAMLDENKCSTTGHEEKQAHNLIATLIALNMVESSIRHLTGKEHGRAPLLKDMLGILAQNNDAFDLPALLTPILTSLLLPNDGINLRNLLWHGFLPVIHRRWLALSIVLVLSMDELSFSSSFDGQDKDNVSLETLKSMRKYESLCKILDHGQNIVASTEKLSILRTQLMQCDSIPDSHKVLCSVALRYAHHPVIFASVVGPILENSLRIMWCKVNNIDKIIAEHGSYYVTLDGHGQRDKHDIVLLPFLSSEEHDSKQIRNKLSQALGAPYVALLIDLFASPPGAPNIRASVAHGVFNSNLFQELESITDTATLEVNANERSEEFASKSALDDMTSALISVLDFLSAESGSVTARQLKHELLGPYRPVFSYSALLLEKIDNLVNKLGPFYDLCTSDRLSSHSSIIPTSPVQREITDTFLNLRRQHAEIENMQSRIYMGFGVDKSLPWSVDHMFQENANNIIASECGAAMLLLSEIAVAAESSFQEVLTGIIELEGNDGDEVSSRRRTQILRSCSIAQLTIDFYSFAAFCGLLFIERRISIYSGEDPRFSGISDDILRLAVKRSRMVISTFSTATMVDRALKAVQQYLVGKAVKAIGKEVHQQQK